MHVCFHVYSHIGLYMCTNSYVDVSREHIHIYMRIEVHAYVIWMHICGESHAYTSYVCRYEQLYDCANCKYECAYLSMWVYAHIRYARMYLCELG